MSKGSYLKAGVTCCFYSNDDGKSRIVCEGVAGAGYVVNEFDTKEEFIDFIKKYCSKHNEKCHLYEALMEKYADNSNT